MFKRTAKATKSKSSGPRDRSRSYEELTREAHENGRRMIAERAEADKRAAEAKALADRTLRWGGALIDPAWIKANGGSSSSVVSIPEPDILISAELDNVVDDIFKDTLIMEEDIADGLNEPVRAGFNEIVGAVSAAIEKALNGGDVAVLGVSRNSDGTFVVNSDDVETYLSKTLRSAMGHFRAAAKNAYRDMYELGGDPMDDLARSVFEHQIVPNIQDYALTADEILAGFDGMALEHLAHDTQASIHVGAGPNHTLHLG